MDLRPGRDAQAAFADAGADGFLWKEASLGDLAGTIRRLAVGKQPITGKPAVSFHTPSFADTRRDEALRDTRLTKREQQIVILIREGRSNKEIAEQLAVSPHTVRCHVHNLMVKVKLHTRLQIATVGRLRNAVVD
jgi:DNA-binding NarL/FixJ family response regulator